MFNKIKFKIINYKLKKTFKKYWKSLTKEEQLLLCQRIYKHTQEELSKALNSI